MGREQVLTWASPDINQRAQEEAPPVNTNEPESTFVFKPEKNYPLASTEGKIDYSTLVEGGFTFSKESTVIERVCRNELVIPSSSERSQGLWEKLGLLKESFTKKNTERALKGLGAVSRVGSDVVAKISEKRLYYSEQNQQKKLEYAKQTEANKKELLIQPGQSIEDFLHSKSDLNTATAEKYGFKKALHGFMKNAPVRILAGAALGALGPVGHIAKYALSAAGGALIGQGIAENRAEAKALEKISHVQDLRDEKTGTYDQAKLREELGRLDDTELATIIGGLWQVSSQRGLRIAKETAELGKGVENNNKYAFLQEKFNKSPKLTKGILKALPIICGMGLLAAPFIPAIAALGVGAMIAGSVGVSALGAGIERLSNGPKSIGQYYDHSLVVSGAVDQLEMRMEGKSDSERQEIVQRIQSGKAEVQKNNMMGAALGVIGIEALQVGAPHLAHGLSSAWNHITNHFSNGGLPAEYLAPPHAVEAKNISSFSLGAQDTDSFLAVHSAEPPITPHLDAVQSGTFELQSPIVLPEQYEHGLHLLPLHNGNILHWEGPATSEHSKSAAFSLGRQIVESAGADQPLTQHQKNEIAHRLAESWVHRGLFNADESLVQAGKEHLTSNINALKEFHETAQNMGFEHSNSAEHRGHSISGQAKVASSLHKTVSTMVTMFKP